MGTDYTINGLGINAAAAAEKEAKGEGEIAVSVSFGGGLDLLFSKKPNHSIRLPPLVESASSPSTPPSAPTVTYLIHHLSSHVLQEREELFREGDTVRPGILVLINDTDWELEGEGDYVLRDGDEVVFISTLHGG